MGRNFSKVSSTGSLVYVATSVADYREIRTFATHVWEDGSLVREYVLWRLLTWAEHPDPDVCVRDVYMWEHVFCDCWHGLSMQSLMCVCSRVYMRTPSLVLTWVEHSDPDVRVWHIYIRHIYMMCMYDVYVWRGEVGGWGRVPFPRNLMSPTPRRKWYLTTGRRAH